MRAAISALTVSIVLGACAATPTAAQKPIAVKSEALFANNFESGVSDWAAFGGTGSVYVTHNRNDVHSGLGALAYSYVASKDRLVALILPVGDIERATAVQFWVKTDIPTALLVSLNEKNEDGEIGYQAVVSTDDNTWQKVTIPVSDFVLDENKTDPDGRLDLGRVNAIGFLDILALFGSMDPNLTALVGDHSGTRYLWLDDFALLTRPTEFAAWAQGVIDPFTRNYMSWVHSSGVHLAYVAAGPSLSVTYERKRPHPAFWFHMARPPQFVRRTSLGFFASTNHATTLYVILDEVGGGKYHAPVVVADGGEPEFFTVNFRDFVSSDDSHDTNGRLDLDKVKMITFADVTQLLDPEAGDASIALRITSLATR